MTTQTYKRHSERQLDDFRFQTEYSPLSTYFEIQGASSVASELFCSLFFEGTLHLLLLSYALKVTLNDYSQSD